MARQYSTCLLLLGAASMVACSQITGLDGFTVGPGTPDDDASGNTSSAEGTPTPTGSMPTSGSDAGTGGTAGIGGAGGTMATSGQGGMGEDCTAPNILCQGTCIDISSDPFHCGACDQPCPTSFACNAGNCACAPGMTECGGVCVDLSADPGHCGSCSHDCQGGSCATGTCQPVVLASGQNGPYGLALDSSRVYWTNYNGGTIKRVPFGGGSADTITSGKDEPALMVILGGNIYWTNNGDGTVRRIAAGGGSSTLLGTSLHERAIGIGAHGTHLYWAEYNDSSRVMHYPVSGNGYAFPVAENQEQPWSIAVDDSNVYWVTHASNGNVIKCAHSIPQDQAQPVVLSNGEAEPLGIAVDATHVYWSNNVPGGAIRRIRIDGSNSETLASAQGVPSYIAIDSSHVYWSNDDGTIKSVPKNGGAITILASGQAEPRVIAVNATSVFWTNYGNGTVMKLAK